MIKYWTPPSAADYEHLNPPGSPLPPVDSELILQVGDRVVRGTRTRFIQDREGKMEYLLEDGRVITDKLWWTHP